MTNSTTGIAVVTAQLARTDRRVLSEAWYSALHLARETPPAHSGTVRRAPGSAAAPNAARALAERPNAPHAANPTATRSAHSANASPGAVVAERRERPTAPMRKVERTLARLTQAPLARATHTVSMANGRVQLLVRTDARATRIVALCSPDLRETVERALAHARFALAGTSGRVVR